MTETATIETNNALLASIASGLAGNKRLLAGNAGAPARHNALLLAIAA